MASASDHRPRRRAAALRYTLDMPAPQVIAKGYGAVADCIVRTAREQGVYVHQSRELVELLMKVDLDAYIPPELYVVVAELLTWLWKLDAEHGGGQAQPPAPDATPPALAAAGPTGSVGSANPVGSANLAGPANSTGSANPAGSIGPAGSTGSSGSPGH